MKKLLCIILVLVMVLMCSCNGKVKDPDADKEKETEKKEEVTTAPETEKPAPPTFFEENGLKIVDDSLESGTYNGVYMGLRVGYPALCGFGTNMGGNRLTKEHTGRKTYCYSGDYVIDKCYGDGYGATKVESSVRIMIGEHELVDFVDYANLALMYKSIGSTENIAAQETAELKALAEDLSKKYNDHKVVTCIVQFQWGKIDNMDLLKEHGTIHGTIGFELLDKYTGTVYSPAESGMLEDQVVEFDGKEYNVSVFANGGGWIGEQEYNKDILESIAAITAVVPKDYDGAVFAVGDGDRIGDAEKTEVFNFKDSYLYGKDSTDFYEPVVFVRTHEQGNNMTDELYSQTKPAADVNCRKTDESIHDLDFKGINAFQYNVLSEWEMRIDVNDTKKLYLDNQSIYDMSVFVTNDNYEIIAQSKSVAPGEKIWGSVVYDYEKNTYYHHGVVYYNEDGSVAYCELVDMGYEYYFVDENGEYNDYFS